jgi:hypothetical protein
MFKTLLLPIQENADCFRRESIRAGHGEISSDFNVHQRVGWRQRQIDFPRDPAGCKQTGKYLSAFGTNVSKP